VFTVPGDGGLDFRPLLAALSESGYTGWLVIEAEQDPRLAPPLEYARRGREHVRALTGI
jgi:inosose dehydratase